jgi:hypothetical protein
MSIESKAKTIWEIYLDVCNYMSDGEPVPKKQVVPLEEAQRLESEIETYRKWLLSHAFGKSNVEVLQEVTLQFEILFPRKEERKFTDEELQDIAHNGINSGVKEMLNCEKEKVKT